MSGEIRGFLIDLDGVLYTGDKPIDGAQDAIRYLQENGYRFRFVSNTTRKSRSTIAKRLAAMGFSVPDEYIFTPAIAAVAWLNNHGIRSFHLLTTGDVHHDFPQQQASDRHNKTGIVIVGDAGDTITYESLNTAFRRLMDGAELVALERDRYWMAPEGISLSAGPFVTALEYATGKTATLIGKPSAAFFDLALQDMGLKQEEVAMIGDDIHTDIGGAQKFGIRGILVKTGKYREDLVQKAGIRPAFVIESIADIRTLL